MLAERTPGEFDIAVKKVNCGVGITAGLVRVSVNNLLAQTKTYHPSNINTFLSRKCDCTSSVDATQENQDASELYFGMKEEAGVRSV